MNGKHPYVNTGRRLWPGVHTRHEIRSQSSHATSLLYMINNAAGQRKTLLLAEQNKGIQTASDQEFGFSYTKMLTVSEGPFISFTTPDTDTIEDLI